MREEKKDSLTAEQILKKETEKYANCKVVYSKTHQGILKAIQEFANQQTKALQEIIEKLNKSVKTLTISNKNHSVLLDKKQSELTQVKEQNKQLFSLWENLTETGEISISENFIQKYDKLKKEITI